jgi:hypothetical protein
MGAICAIDPARRFASESSSTLQVAGFESGTRRTTMEVLTSAIQFLLNLMSLFIDPVSN